MPDFSKYLKRPAGKAVRPSPLPVETYPGIIKSYEYGDQNKNKTPYVRFHLSLTGWPESVSENDRQQANADGVLEPIDLSKRRLRRDFFLTDEAYVRLDEFLRSCGIDLSDGPDYEVVIPQVVGCPVNVEVQQYLSSTTNEIGNQAGKVFGDHDPTV